MANADFTIGVTGQFNPGNMISGAEQAAQSYTDLGTKMQTAATNSGAANTAFNQAGTATSQLNNSLGTTNTTLGTTNTNLGTTNTSLNTTKTNLVGTGTSVSQTNTNIGTMNTSLGSMNTTLQTTDTNLGQTNTALQTTGTDLTTLDTNVDTVNTDLTTMNTSLDSTGTALQTVTQEGQSQDPVLKQLESDWDALVTATNSEITALEQQLPPMKDITTTLGQTSVAAKDLTPSLEKMTTDFESMGAPLNNLNAELATHNTTSQTAKTSTDNWSTSLVTTGLSVTTLVSGIANLYKGIRDYNDGAIKVEASEKKVLDTREKLEKATAKAEQIIKKYGEGSNEAKQAILDETEALKGYNVAVARAGEASEAFADSQLNTIIGGLQTTIGLIGTVAGGWGNYEKMLVKVVATMGTTATANEVAAGSFITLGAGAEAANVSFKGLLATAGLILGPLIAIEEIARSLPDLATLIGSAATKANPKSSFYDVTKANIAEESIRLKQLKSGVLEGGLEGAGIKTGAFLGQVFAGKGTLDEQAKALEEDINYGKELIAVTEQLATETGKSTSEIDKNSVMLRIGTKDMEKIGTATTSNSSSLKGFSDVFTTLDPQLQKFMQSAIDVNDPLNKNNTVLAAQYLAIRKVSDAYQDHSKGITDVKTQAASLVKAIEEQNNAYRGEEQSLLLLAREHDIYSDALIAAAVSTEDNTTAMKEAIAASVDYTSALTNTERNAKLVADGHLAGALALDDLFASTVKATAQNETYTKGLQAVTTMVGGLPPEIENTTANQELWIKAILGSKDALDQLNKEIQDNVLKNFGELQKTWEGMVNTFAQGGDQLKDLKEKLKDLLPKDLYKQVKLQLEITADEQKLKADINMMEAGIFTIVQDTAGQHVISLKPGIEIDKNMATDTLEKLKGTIGDAIDGGDLSSVTGDKLTKVVDEGLKAIKANPENYKQIMLDTFKHIDEIKGDLGQQFSVLTDDALKSFEIPASTIESAKAKIGPIGTQSAAEYNAKLLEELKREGVSQEVIDRVKETFLPAPEEGTKSGTETGTNFGTALNDSATLAMAQLDLTKTVFSTMVKAATLVAEGIPQIFAKNLPAMADAFTKPMGDVMLLFTNLVTHVTTTMQGINGAIAEGAGTFDDSLKVGIDAMTAMFQGGGTGGAGGKGGTKGGAGGLVQAAATAMADVNAAITAGGALFAGSIAAGITALKNSFITGGGEAGGGGTAGAKGGGGIAEAASQAMAEVNVAINTEALKFSTSMKVGIDALIAMFKGGGTEGTGGAAGTKSNSGIAAAATTAMSEVNVAINAEALKFATSMKVGIDAMTALFSGGGGEATGGAAGTKSNSGIAAAATTAMSEVNVAINTEALKFGASIKVGIDQLIAAFGGGGTETGTAGGTGTKSNSSIASAATTAMSEVNVAINTEALKFGQSIQVGIDLITKAFTGGGGGGETGGAKGGGNKGVAAMVETEMILANTNIKTQADLFPENIKDGMSKMENLVSHFPVVVNEAGVNANKFLKTQADKFPESITPGMAGMQAQFDALLLKVKDITAKINTELSSGGTKWNSTVKSAMDKIVKLFDELPKAAKTAVDKINTELSKIKEPTVKVHYDTSGAPKQTGADIFYPARAAAGIDFKTKRGEPQLLLVGEGATPERVTVSRPGEPAYYGSGRSQEGGSGTGTVILNDTINITTSEGTYTTKRRRIFNNLEGH